MAEMRRKWPEALAIQIGVGPMASREDGRKSGIYDISEVLQEA